MAPLPTPKLSNKSSSYHSLYCMLLIMPVHVSGVVAAAGHQAKLFAVHPTKNRPTVPTPTSHNMVFDTVALKRHLPSRPAFMCLVWPISHPSIAPTPRASRRTPAPAAAVIPASQGLHRQDQRAVHLVEEPVLRRNVCLPGPERQHLLVPADLWLMWCVARSAVLRVAANLFSGFGPYVAGDYFPV